MRIFYAGFLFFLIISMSSCLTYRVVEYTITYSDTFNSGEIIVHYTDIRSSEKEEAKREKDFNELIDLIEKDQFLLDQVEEGVYVKQRQIYEENGQIHGEYTGIFADLTIDRNELKIENEERILLLTLDEGEQIESNGKTLISKHNVLLVWPKDQKVLTFKKTTQNYDAQTHSLIEYYNNWKLR